MYSIEQVISGIKNPRFGIQPITRTLYDFYFSKLIKHSGMDFIAADWDTLIILDACRYDLVQDINIPEGKLSAVQSPACETEEFLRKTMGGESFEDLVYVTANPQISKINAEFASIHCVWDELWDDEHQTVMPNDLTDYVLNIKEEYEDKRLIVHYIQPHVPFIGPTAEKIDQMPFEGDTLDKAKTPEKTAWQQLLIGNISRETAWKAYRESLELALEAVVRLLDNLDGKTVITSDHGNAAGEWAIYGHPPDRYIKPITTVPWLELPFQSRREISAADATEGVPSLRKEQVKERLENLGYA